MTKQEKVYFIKQDLNYEYQNRDNYLKGFKTQDELSKEIKYLINCSEDNNEPLHQAIIELKLNDLLSMYIKGM